MKQLLSYNKIYFILTLGLVSCLQNQSNYKQWTKEEAYKMLDSINIKQLLAGYNEGSGYILILKDDSLKNFVRKFTHKTGYPVIVDSLIKTNDREFKSKLYPAKYSINDSEVIMVYYQKIIHPSSNWQGQTPWKEAIVTKYQRLDLNLK